MIKKADNSVDWRLLFNTAFAVVEATRNLFSDVFQQYLVTDNMTVDDFMLRLTLWGVVVGNILWSKRHLMKKAEATIVGMLMLLLMASCATPTWPEPCKVEKVDGTYTMICRCNKWKDTYTNYGERPKPAGIVSHSCDEYKLPITILVEKQIGN